MFRTLSATAIVVMSLTALPAVAQSLPERAGIDRLEDRIDRIENRRDERVDLGPRDRIEDVLDRAEDRRDRRGLDRPRPIDRWERLSWRRVFGH